MIIRHSGYGILAIVITPAAAIASGVIASRVLAIEPKLEQEFYTEVIACLGFIAGSVINWFVGRHLNRRGFVEVVDSETNLPIRIPRHHELFWLPMEYWSVPAFLGGVAVLVRLLRVHGMI